MRNGTTPKAKIQVWAMESLRPLRSRLFRLCGGCFRGDWMIVCWGVNGPTYIYK